MQKHESDFGKGGQRDRVDVRDKKYLGMASLPFDWGNGYDIEVELSRILNVSGFKLPAKNQNGSSSCGGQAFSTYSSVLELVATKTFEERSAKYIYAQTYAPGGGSFGRDNAKVCVKQGVAREAVLTSYEDGNPPTEKFITRSQDITMDTRLDAKNAKHLSYAQVNPDIENMAQSIRDNHGVVMGITGENNGTWLSVFPKPPKKNPNTEWRHFVYAGKAKLINGKKHIGILNSWGNVGENGWQWISEDYFRVQVSDGMAIWNCWTMIFDEVPKLPTIEEKKTDILLTIAALWQQFLELLQQSSVGRWFAGFTGNEREKTGGAARSSDWSKVRKEHLRLHPRCAVCLGIAKREVHHKKMFYTNPELELSPENLITLCESKKNGVTCHQFFGHLGNYKSINPEVKEDALIWRRKIQERNR